MEEDCHRDSYKSGWFKLRLTVTEKSIHAQNWWSYVLPLLGEESAFTIERSRSTRRIHLVVDLLGIFVILRLLTMLMSMHW